MQFKRGQKISQELSTLLKRNTTTTDRMAVAVNHGMTQVKLTAVITRHNNLNREREEMAIKELMKTAIKNCHGNINQANEDLSLAEKMEFVDSENVAA